VIWLLAGAGLLLILFLLNPATCPLLPPCPFRALTGLLCPGCGSTRAVHAALHGNIATAFELNPLLAAYAPILAYAALSTLMLAATGRPLPQPRISSRLIWLLLATIMLFWIVRNIPFGSSR
jgi:hypothetical protein